MTPVAATRIRHSVDVKPGPHGSMLSCQGQGCRFSAKEFVFGTAEALRLGHAHVAYPDSSILELLVGPPCEAEGR